MPRFPNPLASSVGSKTVMAVTGIALFGFVVVHMLGNLQVFLGPERLNAYAKGLEDLGPLLWVARIGLLAYVGATAQVTSYAARTMFVSGLLVLAFVVYHLAHFTFGWIAPSHHALTDAQGRHDVYAMVVRGFRIPAIAVSYLVAQAILASHLSHGLSSAFQTLGVTHPRLAFLKAGFGKAVAAGIFLGNASMPLAALLGALHLPGECAPCGGR
jgi:succinate dehydrogenase / fumarate reductase cytochrome b subunit